MPCLSCYRWRARLAHQDARCPKDVLAWFRDMGNVTNSLSGRVSFVEVLDSIEGIEAAWTAERKRQREANGATPSTSSGGGYETARIGQLHSSPTT